MTDNRPMRLTLWTDYSLRVLMHCAACQATGRRATIAELARLHGISRHHLTKVVMALVHGGWLQGQRGRGGGLRLARAADDIRLGDVVRWAERDFQLVACMAPGAAQAPQACLLMPGCRLRNALQVALQAYLGVLDSYTLADLAASGLSPAGTHQLPIRVLQKPAG
ncbi:Rrf2 family transcriptional regulator [Tepidimonas fonticaldi]|nr:Rrf2 family transcriptional regulator [Tepidimonas fonticaldi]